MKKNSAFYLLVTLILASCGGQPNEFLPTEAWKVAKPEDVGMDGEILATVESLIESQAYRIDNVTVIRDGYMVMDKYFSTFEADNNHVINSCTKSIVSILIGIAVDKGYIDAVDQPILELFAEFEIANRDDAKESITLEDVLTMSSGWDCQDSYLYGWSGLMEMRSTDNWVQYVLGLPMIEDPGEKFEYCNGGSHLLSVILQKTTGLSSEEFAEQHLFAPLGIKDVDWPSSPLGVNIGWGEIRMKPHDMAKIGYLYLNDGVWDGQQIVSSEWVKESTRRHITGTLSDGYGYQWWVDGKGYYMALGYAGQYIIVVPEKDLVVVFTSDLEDNNFFTPENLLNRYIIPAVIE